ncbi:MAG: sulfite exporter TauE/SafE family protein [Vicinamibacterales bacterium]
MSLTLLAAVMAGGALAGGLGALLGIGGGVFLVPFLTLGLGIPIRHALATSLITVIATSSAISAGPFRELVNLRLGLLVAVATVAGSLGGAVLAGVLSPTALYRIFAVSTFGISVVMLTRLDVRNVLLDPEAQPGSLGARYHEGESGREVVYRVKRVPLMLGGSFLAGNLSTLLGVGGGVVTVPLLNAWCGVPIRVAAATSAFTLGVTATSGAIIYYGRGDVIPALAAAAVVGVKVGSFASLRAGAEAGARGLKLLLAIVLMIVAALMLTRTG